MSKDYQLGVAHPRRALALRGFLFVVYSLKHCQKFNMYIYLDESFQLKRGTENQFLTVAGFSTNDPQRIAKMVNRIKKHTLPKKLRQQEVKSTNLIADRAFKPKLFQAISHEDVQIYAITQLKNQLPPNKYFRIQFHTSELLTLQLADHICGVFYQLMQENQMWFDTIKSKLKKIVANPLSFSP